MAHPLTQHPPNMIGFGAPATMSPLGFGFGQPSHSPAFGAHAHSPAFGAAAPHRPAGGAGFGFGSGVGFGSPSSAAGPALSSPLRRLPVRPSPAPMTPSTNNLKRSRRASQSPSSSPSPLASPSLSKRRAGDGDDDLETDRRERKIAGKVTKRIRKDAETATVSTDGPDLGLLLASLPSTSHLPILLELLNENPSLAPRVFRSIPQPPLANCLETLERIVYKIGKEAGSWEPQEGYVATRRWNRVESEVSNFTKTASTYIKFFAAPRDSSPEPNTIFHLLHALTAHALQILALVPADTPPNARPFLDLANMILTNWNAWVGGLSEEVNTRGGMFAAGMVSTWADGLDTVSRAPSTNSTPSSSGSTLASWASPMSMSSRAATNPLVDGFREALAPIRERFFNELGWLIASR